MCFKNYCEKQHQLWCVSSYDITVVVYAVTLAIVEC